MKSRRCRDCRSLAGTRRRSRFGRGPSTAPAGLGKRPGRGRTKPGRFVRSTRSPMAQRPARSMCSPGWMTTRSPGSRSTAM
ncbi:MAG TPA: hypothetical protein DDY91_21330 [Planctomycetaceae bacterium]|nr:hypothetical protein [Planctomycetaceae bacterium]